MNKNDGGSIWLRLRVDIISGTATSLRFALTVTEFKPYEFDSAVLEKIAQTLFRDPPIDPATLRVNKLIPARPVMSLTTNGYGVLAPNPKLFSYMFTAGEYASTKIELESAYDAQSTNRKKIMNDTDSDLQARSSAQSSALASRDL